MAINSLVLHARLTEADAARSGKRTAGWIGQDAPEAGLIRHKTTMSQSRDAPHPMVKQDRRKQSWQTRWFQGWWSGRLPETVGRGHYTVSQGLALTPGRRFSIPNLALGCQKQEEGEISGSHADWMSFLTKRALVAIAFVPTRR